MTDRDSDHLERITLWWATYKFYVIVGLAMILALITGFTVRHSLYTSEQQQANIELFALLDSAENNDIDTAKAQYEALRDAGYFPELGYLADFALASVYIDDKQPEKAKESLQRVIDGSQDPGIQRFAVLRLAELLIIEDLHEAAVELLESYLPDFGRFRILFNERIGDAEFAAGNHEKAQTAYLKALNLSAENAPFYMPVLRIKISALMSSELDAENADTDNTADTKPTNSTPTDNAIQ